MGREPATRSSSICKFPGQVSSNDRLTYSHQHFAVFAGGGATTDFCAAAIARMAKFFAGIWPPFLTAAVEAIRTAAARVMGLDLSLLINFSLEPIHK